MRSKLYLLSQVLLGFILAGFIAIGIFFGTSILNNIHSQYIRYQARNVVTLLNERGGGGTGFIVKASSGKLFILTNRHICKSTAYGLLEAVYRGDRYLLSIESIYEDNDLCLVSAPSTANSYISLAKSSKFGNKAYVVGHHLLEPITVTEGEISSDLILSMPIGQNVDPKDCKGKYNHLEDLSGNPLALMFGVYNQCIEDIVCQGSTIPIQPGNSGSPVLDIYGDLVGVAFAAVESGVHSYVVPLSVVKEFLNEH